MERIAVITGASGGIGLATAEAMAKQGWSLRIVGRTPSKLDAAVGALRALTADVEGFRADFSSLDQVRGLAAELLARDEPLHVLINNAGVWHPEFKTSADGHEDTFAVNHLAAFLLTRLLLPRMRDTPGDRRVVHVSSRLHKQAGHVTSVLGRLVHVANISGMRAAWGPKATFDFEAIDRQAGYTGLEAYAQSKLAQVIISAEFARRESEVTSNAVHPGSVNTDVARDNKVLHALSPLARFVLKTPAQGAETSVHVATSPSLAGQTGGYYARSKPAVAAPIAEDRAVAQRLWDLSVQMTAA